MKGVGVRGASESREAAVRTGLLRLLLFPFPLLPPPLLAKLAELLAVTELFGVVRTGEHKFEIKC